MAFNCIIDDYVKHERYSLLFDQEQMSEIRSKWYDVSEALQNLQSIDQFTGKTRWCEVDAENYRVLMVRAWTTADRTELSMEIRQEAQRYFYFLVVSYVVMLEMRTEIVVDTINVSRISDHELTIKVSMSMMYGAKKNKDETEDSPEAEVPEKPSPKLSIIVNNK